MKIAVYLGSSLHCQKKYNQLAFETGRLLALAGHTIIYGGANVGTMKDLADGAESAGGEIIGVFPAHFKGTKEVQESGVKVCREKLSQMIWVRDFAERKRKMEELSECCLILPGSFGTLDELFTFACDNCIGIHNKKAYILNYEGFYNPLKDLLRNTEMAGFLKPETISIINFCDSVGDFLRMIHLP